MKFEWYVAGLRSRRSQLQAYRTALAEHGVRVVSNWGTARAWLAELDRRINELSAIIAAFEQRYAV